MYWIKNIMVKSPSGCMNKIENVQNMSQKINWCYLSRKLCSPHCRCISSARALFMWRLAVILLLPMFCGPPAGPVPSNWPRCMGRGEGGNGRGMLCVVGSWRSGAINCFWINWACSVCLGTTWNIHSKTVEASVINFVCFFANFFCKKRQQR